MELPFGIKTPLEGIQCLLFFFVIGVNFLISGLTVNFVQLILWTCLKPYSPWLYRKINYYLAYILWSQLEFLIEWWSSSTCLIYTDDKTWERMGKEHSIVLLNHSYEVDFLFGLFLCEQQRTLGSHKALAKKESKKIPVLGWGGVLSEYIPVERNWEVDKLTLGKQIENFRDYPDYVSLHLFAEGTRFTEEKHEASVAYALKTGLTPLKHLLLPRTKGFLMCLEKLRGKFPAVYCATLVFDTKQGALPVAKSLILGRKILAEVLIERIPMDSIPEDPDEASRWLYDRYLHKDQIIDKYQNDGTFPISLPGNKNFEGPIRPHIKPRRLWILFIMVISSSFTIPWAYKALHTLFGLGLSYSVVGIVILGIVMSILRNFLHLTMASKGSQYGRNEQHKAK